MARRAKSKPTAAPAPRLPTLHFVSAAVTIQGQGGALGVRAVHFYILALDVDEARQAFLQNMQGAPFSYCITDIIVTEISRDVLEELLRGEDRTNEGAHVWH